jgi:hypothetical protein
MFANELEFEGNRALLLKVSEPLPKKELGMCIQAALTYKLKK